jgi:predicted RNase H-like nuclease (RuvC/YqgF family)
MGEVGKLEFIMVQIPTKSLYSLWASIMQEVQSRARADATNLEVGRGVIEMLQVTCDQLISKKYKEKENVDNLEQGLTKVQYRIPYNAQAPERRKEENVQIISKTIDGYKKEIEELKQKINPTNPLEV